MHHGVAQPPHVGCEFGIKRGFAFTVHAYTNDQPRRTGPENHDVGYMMLRSASDASANLSVT
jgi:glyceraldehyde-3-phosphate dehydrogenase/erythrose-4-phosphate dehydrogenase